MSRTGLEALARAKAFRERSIEYRGRADRATQIVARESYLQLAITYDRLASDMESVARLKHYLVTTGQVEPSTRAAPHAAQLLD
jgi:hypothetical protein